jgi:cell division cycle 20, cofactor of APC complex
MYTNITPATPPRRTGPRLRLTPSSTVVLSTPSSKHNLNNMNTVEHNKNGGGDGCCNSKNISPFTSRSNRRLNLDERKLTQDYDNDSSLLTPARYKLHQSGTPISSRLSSQKHSGLRKGTSTGTGVLFNTPTKSLSKIFENGDDDRFIPSRQHMNIELCRRALLSGEKRSISNVSSSSSISAAASGSVNDSSNTIAATATVNAATYNQETPLQKEFKRQMLSTLCNIPLDRLDVDGQPTGIFTYRSSSNRNSIYSSASRQSENIRPYNNNMINPFALDTIRSIKLGENSINGDPSTSVLSSVASKTVRKVPNAPVRILDAPDIVDDYYLNLISWSKDNILAVALARSVYLWNAESGDINHLITVQGVDYVTSVSWCTQPGQTKLIAVGTHLNSVHIFDGSALVKVRTLEGATGRIASLSWNNNHNFLSAGDRDAVIMNHDLRSESHIVSKYCGHVQEVCGLKWNDDGSCLASGGNENYLCLWDVAMQNRLTNRNNNSAGNRDISQDYGPRLVLKQHKAAVKALDWCPFHRGLLASGGGTADRSIKFWNSSSGAMLNTIDTGSQVCSLLWSKHHREICSSHGYSENQLILWKYPSMTKIKELTGHTARVLNMDMSPDGTSVVSAGADETLRFWNLFDTPSQRTATGVLLGDMTFSRSTIR